MLELEALLAAVHDAPWDDGPREVFGDLLQQREDPRGEFIALDLLASPTPVQRKRRNVLLNAHGKAWFPASLHQLVKRSAVYERGFMAIGELTRVDRTPIELTTFRELEVKASELPDFDHPVFRGIESWRGLAIHGDHDDRGAPFKRCGPQLRVKRLGVRADSTTTPAQISARLRREAWPAITEIVVEIVQWDDWESDARLPGWLQEVAAVLDGQFPGVTRVDLAPFASFVRTGMVLRVAEIFPLYGLFLRLGRSGRDLIVASADARDRWLRWLAETDVPITAPVIRAAGRIEARLGTLIEALPADIRTRVRAGPALTWRPLPLRSVTA